MAESGGLGLLHAGHTSTLKTGPIRFYRRNDWKPLHVVLDSESLLAWFEKEGDTRPDGSVLLKTVHRFIALGSYTEKIADGPSLPSGGERRNVLAIPDTPSSSPRRIHWLIFDDDDHRNSWMQAMAGVVDKLKAQGQLSRHSLVTKPSDYRRQDSQRPPAYTDRPEHLDRQRSRSRTDMQQDGRRDQPIIIFAPSAPAAAPAAAPPVITNVVTSSQQHGGGHRGYDDGYGYGDCNMGNGILLTAVIAAGIGIPFCVCCPWWCCFCCREQCRECCGDEPCWGCCGDDCCDKCGEGWLTACRCCEGCGENCTRTCENCCAVCCPT